MPGGPSSGRPSRSGSGWGLTVVYAVWGSTYLAIRVAIETIPPLLLISVRFLVAGMLLYGWIREVLDVPIPSTF